MWCGERGEAGKLRPTLRGPPWAPLRPCTHLLNILRSNLWRALGLRRSGLSGEKRRINATHGRQGAWPAEYVAETSQEAEKARWRAQDCLYEAASADVAVRSAPSFSRNQHSPDPLEPANCTEISGGRRWRLHRPSRCCRRCFRRLRAAVQGAPGAVPTKGRSSRAGPPRSPRGLAWRQSAGTSTAGGGAPPLPQWTPAAVGAAAAPHKATLQTGTFVTRPPPAPRPPHPQASVISSPPPAA